MGEALGIYTCSLCGKTGPAELFYPATGPRRVKPVSSWCRECHADYEFRKQHGAERPKYQPLPGEEWRPVEWTGGAYEVSNLGRLRSVRGTGAGRWYRLRKTRIDSNGYPSVVLGPCTGRRTCRIHCLVAAAFLGPRPKGHDVNHKDANKTNNRADNLEYVTELENTRHALALGLVPEGKGHPKLTDDQVRQIRRLHRVTPPREVAAQFGVSRSTIQNVWYGVCYTDVE